MVEKCRRRGRDVTAVLAQDREIEINAADIIRSAAVPRAADLGVSKSAAI
jgi:hypothetical protein